MPTSTNRTLSEFLANAFPWTIEIEWFGKGGVHVLDDDRCVEITATTDGRAGEYSAVDVEIISKRSGSITARRFRYDDHLIERADTRDDYPLGANRCFMVIDHCGLDWYIARPATPEDFSRAVERFIELYR